MIVSNRTLRDRSDAAEPGCGCATCAAALRDPSAPTARGGATTAAVDPKDDGNGSVQVGGSYSGAVNFAGDTDQISVQLQAGKTYLISLRGTGTSALADPYLEVAGPGGASLGSDDDGGTGANSLITIKAATSGTYRIAAGALAPSGGTGGYTVDVRAMGTDTVKAGFTSTTVLGMNRTTFGFVETKGDIDTYKVTLTAGRLYTFEVAGGADYNTSYLAVPANELDTKLTLFDAKGNQVAFNDDIEFSDVAGEGDISSALGYAVQQSGTYYLRVEAYQNDTGGGTGGYALLSRETDLSGLDPLDSIDWGSKLASNNVTVYFAKSGEVFDGVTSLGWTAYEIKQAMAALQTWADVTNLSFSIASSAAKATFKLVTTNSDEYLGYFNPPGTQNAGVGVFAINGTGWDRFGSKGGLEQGGYGWITLIHEFGHGIGLAHPHDDGGTSDIMAGVFGPYDSFGAFDLNQGVYTTMSYNDGWQTHPNADETGEIPAAPTAWGYQGGPSAFDIAMVQAKYGADAGRNAGNSVYVLPRSNAPGTFWKAIWDVSGVDTIRHDGTAAAVIDLNAATLDYSPTGGGVISWVAGIYGGFTIAKGVVIEKALGGGGSDVLIGNAAANLLDGRGGADRMIGRAGDDTYVVASFSDKVEERAGEGTDTIRTALNYTLGANLENLTLISHSQAGTGNGLANLIIGSPGSNVIKGEGGADTLRGGGGHDTLYGGGGHDDLDGGTASDILYGGVASDELTGGSGNDRLYGGPGHDTLAGGIHGDFFYFDSALNRSTNVDRLLDFDVAEDLIMLSRVQFDAIGGSGTLAAAAFVAGAAAADASDRIIYNPVSGELFYDADGTGAIAQILFARLQPGLALTNADFVGYI